MKKMSKEQREALKEFLENLFESKFSKKAIFGESSEELVEEEVCVEPFALKDADGDMMTYEELQQQFEELNELQDFMELQDLYDDELYQINEEEILYDSEEKELEKLKELAEEISSLMIPCNVGGQSRYLVDKANCNIKPVPILGLNLVSPANLEILKVMLDSSMESEEEIELTVALKQDEQVIVYKFDMGTLASMGLVVVVEDLNAEIQLSALEFRGLTKSVDMLELSSLLLNL